jgi:hypothetical protein
MLAEIRRDLTDAAEALRICRVQLPFKPATPSQKSVGASPPITAPAPKRKLAWDQFGPLAAQSNHLALIADFQLLVFASGQLPLEPIPLWWADELPPPLAAAAGALCPGISASKSAVGPRHFYVELRQIARHGLNGKIGLKTASKFGPSAANLFKKR